MSAVPALEGPWRDVDGVVLLALYVLIPDQPVAVAGAGDVDARRAVAVGGEPVVRVVVARPGAVAAAIGDVFEDRRHRLGGGLARQQQAGGELAGFGRPQHDAGQAQADGPVAGAEGHRVEGLVHEPEVDHGHLEQGRKGQRRPQQGRVAVGPGHPLEPGAVHLVEFQPVSPLAPMALIL